MDKECGNDRVTSRHDLILWTVPRRRIV